jgi:hypothetical protein
MPRAGAEIFFYRTLRHNAETSVDGITAPVFLS